MVIAIKKYYKISLIYLLAPLSQLSLVSSTRSLKINTININKAEISPKIPISLAIFSNFNYKGVNSSSEVIISYIFPIEEFLPTLMTIINPVPVNIFVPAINTILGIS